MTSPDDYVYIIIALLPLSALLLVTQVNPYHALILRGILGAIAALVYAVLGAADVALTEALMGSLLAITLYAVAVRSSLVVRLGVIQDEILATESLKTREKLLEDIRTIFQRRYLRVERITYPDEQTLLSGLKSKEIHLTCAQLSTVSDPSDEVKHPFHTTTRVQRLYEILQPNLSSSVTILNYLPIVDEI